jgi:hypothetical protein
MMETKQGRGFMRGWREGGEVALGCQTRILYYSQNREFAQGLAKGMILGPGDSFSMTRPFLHILPGSDNMCSRTRGNKALTKGNELIIIFLWNRDEEKILA